MYVVGFVVTIAGKCLISQCKNQKQREMNENYFTSKESMMAYFPIATTI